MACANDRCRFKVCCKVECESEVDFNECPMFYKIDDLMMNTEDGYDGE